MLVRLQAAFCSVFKQETSMRHRLILHGLLIAVILTPTMSTYAQDAPQTAKDKDTAAQDTAAQDTAAQDTAEKDTAEKDTAAESGTRQIPLNVDQQALASRFERFQKTMRQMAEQMRSADPERADLLLRAIGRSQEDRIVGQMRIIQQLLQKEQFGSSVERQEDLIQNLHALLDLLQSENRLTEIEKERARIKDLLKDVNRLVGKEKDTRAINERGGNEDRATDTQEDVKDETEGVINKIDKQDAGRAGEGKPGEGKPGEG